MAVAAPSERAKPVCMCYPLRAPGEPAPWTSECDECLARVRDGAGWVWCQGGHAIIGPPFPTHCPDCS